MPLRVKKKKCIKCACLGLLPSAMDTTYIHMYCVYVDICVPTIAFNPLQKGNKVNPAIAPAFVPVKIFRNSVTHQNDRGQSSSKLQSENMWIRILKGGSSTDSFRNMNKGHLESLAEY